MPNLPGPAKAESKSPRNQVPASIMATLTSCFAIPLSTSFLISADYNVENLQSVVFAIGPSGPIQENVPSPIHNGLFSAQIDHKFSDTNRATFFFSHKDDSARNSGVGGFTLPEAGTNDKIGQERFVYSQETTFSPTLVNQFHLLVDYDYASTTSLQASPKIVVQGAFIGGAQTDDSRDEEHFDLNELLLYSHGKHLLKMGVDVPYWGRVGIDNRQDAAGTFYFSNLADYEAQRPYSLTLQQGDTNLAFFEKALGAFIDDDYTVRPNLTVSVGLRYDWQNIFSDREILLRACRSLIPRPRVAKLSCEAAREYFTTA